ncbi:asparagine synthase (glutamine-hydrolyzing) [Verrucomicrobiota bacterium]
MCGIAGFLGSFSPGTLDSMSSVMAHRGPDDSGVHFADNPPIGLAHRRLSIIDVSSRGHQPMWDAGRNAVIAFNGEIYNYRELRAGLEARGYSFNSTSDTEVLLNLYLDEGPKCLARLNGIFAFALWDPGKQALLLARDGMGVKPLYYTRAEQGFLFASEIKSLLEAPGVDRSVDHVAVSHYLSYLYAPAPRTMLAAVKKLMPGCAAIVTHDGIQKEWQFYELPYDQQIGTPSAEDAVEELHECLRAAVERQMVADVPVGAFLSGGLDSSSIVTFAREFTKEERFPCFTIGIREETFHHEGSTYDLPYAERVAKYLDVDLNTVWVGPEMANEIEEMVYHLDEPQGDPSAISILLMCRMAREHGIKVLLSGSGGDDIFTGYMRHYALARERWWTWLPRRARSGLRVLGEALPARAALGRRLQKVLRHADLDENERIAAYFMWLGIAQVPDLYGPAMREALVGRNPLDPLLEAIRSLPPTTHPINRMLYLDSKYFLPDHNLNYTDKMSMATGVEVRVPLLDPDLVALAARLPPNYKQHGSTGKWIFRKAMEPHLPREIAWRPKTGFQVPIRSWIRNELREMMQDTLSEGAIGRRGLFDAAAVSQLMEMHLNGRIDAGYPLFALACIEIWMRRFID